MKFIPLTQGKSAIVDDEDFEELSRFKWRVNSRGYAQRGTLVRERVDKKQAVVSMHRTVNRTPPGMYTDHINGNQLDNRRSNLRSCSPSESNMHRKVQKNNKLGLKGVSLSQGRYKAIINVDKKPITIGSFDTPEEAFEAYRLRALQMHGRFARFR